MSLRNSSTEGTVFDSVSKRASHIIPSRVPHGVVVCIDQPMRTCSPRQSGILAPTPDSESTASFTDEMGGTMDRRRDRTNPPDRLMSPCTRHSRVQALLSPDRRAASDQPMRTCSLRQSGILAPDFRLGIHRIVHGQNWRHYGPTAR